LEGLGLEESRGSRGAEGQRKQRIFKNFWLLTADSRSLKRDL
jgi:hypothetical protein